MVILRGEFASPGLASGAAFWINGDSYTAPRRHVSAAAVRSELHRLRVAAREAEKEMQELAAKISSRQPAGFKDIFAVYSLILRDPAILSRIEERVRKERVCADWAVEDVYKDVADAFARMKNRHLAARREDVEDVKRFLLDHLSDRPQNGAGSSALTQKLPARPFIAVAHEITPAQTMALLCSKVAGMVTRMGGRTSHVAIIAREIGIPHVFGLPADRLNRIRDGDLLLIDGPLGRIVANPTRAAAAAFRKRLGAFQSQIQQHLKQAQMPARTKDGIEVHLRANIETDQDAALAKKYGARGVGLFRTEYLYLGQVLPNEEALFKAYRRVARAVAPHPLVLRTMDLGGDKFLSPIDFPPDLNPMLGMRAIRLCLARPKLLLPQLAAACRANTGGNLKLCLPLVSAVEEVLEVKRHLQRVAAALRRRGVPFKIPPLGIMVEVPSVAVRIDRFVQHVDFFSIGTNDLIQYTLAVSRTQEQLAHLYRPFNPSVLWLLARIVKICGDARKDVHLCGEEAHNPLIIPFLIGIGLRDFSMAPPALADIKKLIWGLDLDGCYAIARRMLEFGTTSEVEAYIRTEVYPMLKTLIPHHYSYVSMESEL